MPALAYRGRPELLLYALAGVTLPIISRASKLLEWMIRAAHLRALDAALSDLKITIRVFCPLAFSLAVEGDTTRCW